MLLSEGIMCTVKPFCLTCLTYIRLICDHLIYYTLLFTFLCLTCPTWNKSNNIHSLHSFIYLQSTQYVTKKIKSDVVTHIPVRFPPYPSRELYISGLNSNPPGMNSQEVSIFQHPNHVCLHPLMQGIQSLLLPSKWTHVLSASSQLLVSEVWCSNVRLVLQPLKFSECNLSDHPKTNEINVHTFDMIDNI